MRNYNYFKRPVSSHVRNHSNFHSKSKAHINYTESQKKIATISEAEYFKNMKYYLENFKFCTLEPKNFSSQFINCKEIFSPESQIPDTFTMSLCPFNRDKSFYVPIIKGKNSQNQPFSIKNFYNKNDKKNENIYPKEPLKLKYDCDLALNLSTKKSEKKESESKASRNILYFGNFFQKLLNKTWAIQINVNGKTSVYGPYDTEKIYTFLSKNYGNEDSNCNDYNLLVVDVAYDVHYQPRNLLMELKEEYSKAEKMEQNH